MADAAERKTDTFIMDDVYLELDRVEAVLSTLVHAYGGDANLSDTAKLRGVNDSMQYAFRALRRIKAAILDEPDKAFSALYVSEAVGLADLMESVTDGKDLRFSDGWICNYFSAMEGCVYRARNDFARPIGSRVI